MHEKVLHKRVVFPASRLLAIYTANDQKLEAWEHIYGSCNAVAITETYTIV